MIIIVEWFSCTIGMAGVKHSVETAKPSSSAWGTSVGVGG